MDREEFRRRFVRAAVAAREQARRLWSKPLPEPLRFIVLLNCSYDGHPLHPDERVFPDDDSFSRRLALRRCTADESVDLLWRDGLIPEWIDVAPLGSLRAATLIEVCSCGRFTANAERLYHQRAGNPPFHVFLPVEPVDLRRHEQSWVLASAKCRSADDLRLARAHAVRLRSLDVEIERVGEPGSLLGRRFAWRFRRLQRLRLESAAALQLPDRWPRALRSLTITAPAVAGSLPVRLDSLSLHLADSGPDALARVLASVASVRDLDLRGSPVDDSLAEQLAARLSLHSLALAHTRVTSAGLQKIYRRHPVTRITLA